MAAKALLTHSVGDNNKGSSLGAVGLSQVWGVSGRTAPRGWVLGGLEGECEVVGPLCSWVTRWPL